MTVEVTRAQVLSYRWHVQQLDRSPGIATGPADCDLLDLGIQNTGPDGAAWALHLRGTPPGTSDDLALAWTLRGAPHRYRRADLPAVAVATAPLSDADAAKRIFDANRPLKAAGIPTLDALRTVATEMRDIVRQPTVKGTMSSALTARMDDPYLRFCRPCNATHMYEMPFRLAALQAGLELRPETSPPVLERIPGWRGKPYTRTAADADARFDVIRGYLRFFGPADPKAAAAYIDAPVKDVKAHWPSEVTEVSVDGAPRSILSETLDALLESPADDSVRLLGPFDPYLQLKDRELLVADEGHRKALWPTLGRPGAVAVGGEIVGLWRPRTAGKKLSVEVTAWEKLPRSTQAAVEQQARALATFRGLSADTVTVL
ncbi:winged helix DNA-binding domain-containing protein [Rhodococcus sp. PAM 2766]|uniref:Winged helix DNA-binding domain-containing protein n=1 Tax=Rhodococcus parequi TaxID=3137122 RepID=A0ABW9FFY5_9NOCA